MPPPVTPVPEDPLLADDVAFEGPTPSDLTARHDDYLYGELEDSSE